jgi:hypothetical protein
MWEIWTRSEPWEEIADKGVHFPRILTERVTAGDRPRLPDECESAPVGYYELMKQCWADKPAERPRFDEIVRMLDARIAIFDRRRSSAEIESTM